MPQGNQAPTYSDGANQLDGQCHDEHISQTGQTLISVKERNFI